METTSQDGTNIEYQIFIKANITFVTGEKLVLHLTKEEYESFNTTVAEERYNRWRFLRKSADGKRYIINEWIFLDNIMRISYTESLTENGFTVKTRIKTDVDKDGNLI